jgi:hypothetical protein
MITCPECNHPSGSHPMLPVGDAVREYTSFTPEQRCQECIRAGRGPADQCHLSETEIVMENARQTREKLSQSEAQPNE